MEDGMILDTVALLELAEYDERKRGERVIFMKRLERESKQRRVWADKFAQSTMWRSVKGEVAIADMTPRHAANTVAMLERDAVRYAELVGRTVGVVSDQAWLRNTPLYRALKERAEERPTVRDRLKERRNKKEFAARQVKRVNLDELVDRLFE